LLLPHILQLHPRGSIKRLQTFFWHLAQARDRSSPVMSSMNEAVASFVGVLADGRAERVIGR
jgi:hypothetical protein